MSEISRAPLTVIRMKNPDITAITKMVTELVNRKNVRLLVIDPLQMITVRRDLPYENREREIGEAIRRLKRLALDTSTAIVLTSQLSTNPGPRQPVPPAPSLADLRDSGTITDIVVLMHRPDAYERDHERAGEVDLILAKHRAGPTATVVVAHQLHYGRFATLAAR